MVDNMQAGPEGETGASRLISADAFEGAVGAGIEGRFLAVGNRAAGGGISRTSNGRLIEMRVRNRILSFDTGSGDISCEAGVTLFEIMRTSGRHSFFLPVAAGSGDVTVGAAVATDIVGRNHAARGAFGVHVRSLTLLRSDGRVLVCSRTEHADLFAATIGGLGLTGLILSVDFRLMKVPSAHLQRHSLRFASLHEGLAQMEDWVALHEYVHLSIDTTAGGRSKGRGLLVAADHADASSTSELPELPNRRAYSDIARQTMRGLADRVPHGADLLRYHEAGSGERIQSVAWWEFFWPRDRLGRWRAGPVACFQCLLPATDGIAATELALIRLVERMQAARHAGLQAELRALGDADPVGLLSLAGPGHLLSLLMIDRGAATRALFAQMAGIVVDAGGVMFADNSHFSAPDHFRAGFSRWRELEQLRDPAFLSDFWERNAVNCTNSEKIGV